MAGPADVDGAGLFDGWARSPERAFWDHRRTALSMVWVLDLLSRACDVNLPPTTLECPVVKSAVETLNPTRVKLTVEVPFDELKPSLDAAYKTIGSQINVPGFRAGKVPARIIDQRVGRGAVLQEAVNDALPRFYGQAVEENKIRPLGQPEVDVTEVPAEPGQDLKFTIEVDVRPVLVLPDYEGLPIEVDVVDGEATAADVEERMTTLRQRFGTLTGVERIAATGDFVSIDLAATIGEEEIDTAKGISYEIGTGNMIDGLDDALVGMAAQERKTFNAPLSGGEHEGQDAEINVTVQSVKERVLPDLDDDFAQLASEFDTLDELRADIQGQAERAKKMEQGVQARDKVLEHLLANTEIPVPDALVEAEVTQHLEGESRVEDEEHRAEVSENTRTAMRSQFLLDAIAEKEQVSVGQPELIEYLVMSAQQYGMEPNEFAKAVDEGGQIPAMVAEVARRKALAAVLEKANIVDTAGTTVDLHELNVGDDALGYNEGAGPDTDTHEDHDHDAHEGDDHEVADAAAVDAAVVDAAVVDAEAKDA
jgi:trigger factor